MSGDKCFRSWKKL